MEHHDVGCIKLEIIHPVSTRSAANLANNTDSFARYAENQASLIRNKEETPVVT
jgi:hypothetical protein